MNQLLVYSRLFPLELVRALYYSCYNQKVFLRCVRCACGKNKKINNPIDIYLIIRTATRGKEKEKTTTDVVRYIFFLLKRKRKKHRDTEEREREKEWRSKGKYT